MEFQYEKALKEHNIQLQDLPEDARTGIREIKNSVNLMNLAEKKGKKVSTNAIKRVKAMDKWVYYEILDFLEDTDKNEDEIPYESEDVQESLQESYDDNSQKNVQEVKGDGVKINEELSNLHKEGKNTLTLDEIKRYAPNTYNAIFEVYSEGETNGVETKSYSLIEFEKQQYKLTKR